jgi:hypothetical protein
MESVRLGTTGLRVSPLAAGRSRRRTRPSPGSRTRSPHSPLRVSEGPTGRIRIVRDGEAESGADGWGRRAWIRADG